MAINKRKYDSVSGSGFVGDGGSGFVGDGSSNSICSMSSDSEAWGGGRVCSAAIAHAGQINVSPRRPIFKREGVGGISPGQGN